MTVSAMNNISRTRLCQIVEQHGSGICSSPQRLRGLLLDLCGEQRREVNLLCLASTEGVVETLLTSVGSVLPVVISTLVRRLQENVGLTENSAAWAVESWVLALGLHNSSLRQGAAATLITDDVFSSDCESSLFPLRDHINSIGMKFRKIPAGSFLMGCEESSSDLEKDGFGWVHVENLAEEAPSHKVIISQTFFMGAHVVTREQFTTFVRATGFTTEAEISGSGGDGYVASKGQNQQRKQFNWKKTGFAQDANHPVVNVSWNDAVAFCAWLSQEEGQIYRLPTEAEWEYCCRAGTNSRFFTGNGVRTLQGFANVADDSFQKKYRKIDFPCFQFDDGWPFTSPVGWFRPNQFGLFDMLGNVLEWCSDWYGSDYYSKSCLEDPQGPTSGTGRVLRGGGRSFPPFFLRSSCRGFNDPGAARNDTSFRVVMIPENL